MILEVKNIYQDPDSNARIYLQDFNKRYVCLRSYFLINIFFLDGNPLLGLGYSPEATPSTHRIPPGGYSHKLW